MRGNVLQVLFTVLVTVNSFAQNRVYQRLITQAFDGPAVDGKITLEAYCVDPTLIWPRPNTDMKLLNQKSRSEIKYKENGIIKNSLLAQALNANLVKIVSSGKSINIISRTSVLEIISFTTSGILVGLTGYNNQVDVRLYDILNDEENWDTNQLSLHKFIVKNYTDGERQSKIREYAENWIKKNGAGQLRSSSWSVSSSGNVIRINNNGEGGGGGGGPAPFSELSKVLIDKFEDEEFCISVSPTDSSLQIKFSGKYKGELEIVVNYSSKKKCSILKIDDGIVIKGCDKANPNCEVKLSEVEFCLYEGVSFEIEICGIIVPISLENISKLFSAIKD
jgi:hypothetical protein